MTNAITKHDYIGYNYKVLDDAKKTRLFSSHEWMTFHQAMMNGYQIKKGAKGVRIKFYSEDKEDKTKKRKIVHWTSLFNLDECIKK